MPFPYPPIPTKAAPRLYRGSCLPLAELRLHGQTTIPTPWVTFILDAIAIWFMKKWVHLAKPGDPSKLYLPQKEGGTVLPVTSMVYQKQPA